MSLNFGILGKVLFSPKDAFESIKDQTTMQDGIIMASIFVIISSIISMVLTLVGAGAYASMMIGGLVIGIVVAIIVTIIMLLIMGALSAKLAGAIGKGSGDVGKTIGFLGYAAIVGLIFDIIGAVLLFAMGGMSLTAGSLSGLAAIGGIALIMGIIEFVWSLYVSGSAVAAANNTSLGAGIAAYFISALIVMVVIVGIVVAILATIGLSMMGGMGMMGI